MTIGPESKRAHLLAFIQQYLGGRSVILVGAGIGGAIAMDFAIHHPTLVERLVLIAPEVLPDMMARPIGQLKLPKFAAEIGVKLLQQTDWAQSQSHASAFFDKAAFMTEETEQIRTLHTLLPGLFLFDNEQ